MKKYPLLTRITLLLFFVILFIYSIVIARHVLYPIALAVLCAYLLYPLAAFLEYRAKIPRLIAVIFSVLLFMFLIGLFTHVVISQIQKFAQDEEILSQARSNLGEIHQFVEKKIGIKESEQKNEVFTRIQSFLQSGDNTQKLLRSLVSTVEIILFIPIFTIFMLYYRNRGQTFIHKLAESRHAELAEHLIEQISKIMTRYVTGVTTVVVILAVLHSGALYIIGVEYPLMIGLLAACFSFIPYFGTIISGLLPLFFTVLVQGNLYLAFAVVIYFIAISLIDHNIITPGIVGGKVHLNPFITILSIIIGAAIWGIPGMIVVVPFVAVLKAIFDKVDSLKPFGYILGVDENRQSLRKSIRSFFSSDK